MVFGYLFVGVYSSFYVLCFSDLGMLTQNRQLYFSSTRLLHKPERRSRQVETKSRVRKKPNTTKADSGRYLVEIIGDLKQFDWCDIQQHDEFRPQQRFPHHCPSVDLLLCC